MFYVIRSHNMCVKRWIVRGNLNYFSLNRLKVRTEVFYDVICEGDPSELVEIWKVSTPSRNSYTNIKFVLRLFTFKLVWIHPSSVHLLSLFVCDLHHEELSLNAKFSEQTICVITCTYLLYIYIYIFLWNWICAHFYMKG